MKKITLNNSIHLQVWAALLMLTANLGFLKVGSLSMSFFFGAFLICMVYISCPQYAIVKKDMRLLMIFVPLSLISLVLSPVGFDGSSIYTGFQIVYWFIIANIFSNISKIAETKPFLISIIAIIVIITTSFILILGKNDFYTENTASCIVVTLWPIGLFVFKKKMRLLYILFVVYALLVIGSRTGIILVLVQLICFQLIRKISGKIMFISIVTIAGLLFLLSLPKVRLTIAEVIFPEDQDMQILIEMPEIAFQMDKSWVQRRIQQEKSKQIVSMNPVLGIGPLNFERYNININISNMADVDDGRLMNQMLHSDNRSAHNSYYQLMAESGITGFVLVLSFFIFIVLNLYKRRKDGECFVIILVSSLGLFPNLFMVSGFYATSTWILLGIYNGYARCKKN